MKRLGPELKMPALKAPPFVTDLYWDLRDRRLLPLVALVVVAIAAVPFLLGGGSKKAPAPVAGATASAPGTASAGASSLAVVEATPGLRDYRKRLAHRTPTDPFKQRFTAPQVSGAQLQESTSTSSTTTSTSETTTTTTESSPGGSPSSSGGSGEPQLTLFAFAIDVQITRIEGGGSEGAKTKGEATTRHKVLPTTPLPGEKAPVVTYMGVDVKEGAKALLMVSNNVKSIYGDGSCLSGTDVCQLLAVEPGFPETFLYGNNDVRYKIKVLKIEPVLTGHT